MKEFIHLLCKSRDMYCTVRWDYICMEPYTDDRYHQLAQTMLSIDQDCGGASNILTSNLHAS